MNIGVTFNLKYNWTICTNYKKQISIPRKKPRAFEHQREAWQELTVQR